MARGRLRVYLGAAPGVGKTYAMLGEGRRRAERGTDVVVGLVEDHGRAAHRRDARRPRGGAPARRSPTAGSTLTEMDLDAVLARRPAVALVDELAHTNVARLAQREAVAGRRGAARRRHRRHLDRQHPAPRVAQRRRREDHRRAAARAHPRRRRARRRPDRARRHGARGAAPADGARQRLRGRQGRRRPRQLLPGRQPHRPARAGAAVDGRQGRRGACSATAPSTTSTAPGRPASASSSRSPAGRRARP